MYDQKQNKVCQLNKTRALLSEDVILFYDNVHLHTVQPMQDALQKQSKRSLYIATIAYTSHQGISICSNRLKRMCEKRSQIKQEVKDQMQHKFMINPRNCISYRQIYKLEEQWGQCISNYINCFSATAIFFIQACHRKNCAFFVLHHVGLCHKTPSYLGSG